ncbi:class C sortase [Streptococcus suis]|uniref:class C sortase n=1 Tax=Streptococcus suis TaxID=1307 RepID=UPI00022F89DD|nr:class C sortase [Streptococcus suis]AER14628.1 sortase SrtC1 [Streptococcus suis SS12]MBL1159389.1 class C sortase [Streptococcus suis]MBL1182908.1 class C sortase [Streptococcus suis]MBL1190046.1 class C sortase [Streptococcus suis]MBL1191998.1 class C sortase [Streptococcus suis]
MIKWLKKKGPSFIMPLIFILGIGLLAYPSVSDYWNSLHQSEAIMSYSDTVSDMTADQYKEIIDSARQYNQEKPLNWNVTASDIEAYNQELNFNKDGIMGYIEIPKIDVKLSIFHGTDETVLETSIGHLEGTSLPVGGLGTHSVLSGHRGLPSARLFSDLDKLREGDIFTIHVLNETLTYKVDQIRVVEPSDLSALTMEPQKDLLTLVTCTPYGINTHRLLVRGYRIENVNGSALVTSDAIQIKAIFIAPFIATPILFVILIYIFITTSKTFRSRNRNQVLDDFLVPKKF